MGHNTKRITFDSHTETQQRIRHYINLTVYSILIFIVLACFLKVATILFETYNEATLKRLDIDKSRKICNTVGEKPLQFNAFCSALEIEGLNTPELQAVGKTYDRIYYGIMGTLYTTMRSTWTLCIVAAISVLFGAYANHQGWLRVRLRPSDPSHECDFSPCGLTLDQYNWVTDSACKLSFPPPMSSFSPQLINTTCDKESTNNAQKLD